jgi:bifunctional DNase/RNase
MLVRMFVSDLAIDHGSQTPVLLLRSEEGDAVLPICIGLMEASAIAAVRERMELPRPLTHDLLKTIMDSLDGTLDSVEITGLEDGTFYACLRVERGATGIEIDSRPSDAIALALRFGVPIWVSDHVLAEAGVIETEHERWRRYLENLDPDDFGKYKM